MTTNNNNNNVSRFIQCPVTFWASVARVVLLLELVPTSSLSSSWLESPALSAILEDPIFTLRHVREARAVRNLFATKQHSKFNDAYRLPNTIHLPPLLLAALDGFYSITSRIHRHHPYAQRILFGILILAIDFMISVFLERIARHVLGLYKHSNNNNNSLPTDEQHGGWEESLEKNVPEAVRPPLAHIFGISEDADDGGDDDDSDDDDENENSSSEKKQKEMSSSLSSSQPPPPLIRLRDVPLGLALLYYASPVTILSGSAFLCFRNLPFVALLWAMDLAVNGVVSEASSLTTTTTTPTSTHRSQGGGSDNVALASFALALSAYMDVHNVIFVIPLSTMSMNNKNNNNNRRPQQLATLFLLYFGCLHGLSFLLVGQDLYRSVLVSTHLYSFQISRIRPSLSTLWYFGMEMFDRFHVYFSVFLGGTPYLLVLPLTIRLYRYSTVLIAIFWMLGVVFRPPGTLYNLNVGLCLFGLCPRSLIRLRTIVSTVALCALPVPAVLFVVNHWLWLETGSGEANFCFFQCLAYNVFAGLLLVEFTGASLRRDKVLRVTEKMLLVSSSSIPKHPNDGFEEQIRSINEQEEAKRE